MTLACGICKRFLAAAATRHCNRNSKHVFHENIRASSGEAVSNSGACKLLCPLCGSHNLPRALRVDSCGLATGTAVSLVTREDDSLKTLISSLLQVTNIKTTMQDLTLIKTQLSSFELNVQHFTSSFSDLSARTDSLCSVTRQDQQTNIVERALEVNAKEGGICDLRWWRLWRRWNGINSVLRSFFTESRSSLMKILMLL